MPDAFFLTPTRGKRVGDAKRFTLDLKRWVRSYWLPAQRYGVGDFTRTTVGGFALQCTVAGESSDREPAARVLGATVTDGSVTWIIVVPATNAVDPISSVAWIVPAPLVLVSQTNTTEEASVVISGGLASTTYRIKAAVTPVSGQISNWEFDLEVQ